MIKRKQLSETVDTEVIPGFVYYFHRVNTLSRWRHFGQFNNSALWAKALLKENLKICFTFYSIFRGDLRNIVLWIKRTHYQNFQ